MKRYFFLFALLVCLAAEAAAQIPGADAPSKGGMALSPARFELEMKPGTETTVVVNLDYRAAPEIKEPARIVATLNDWNITPDGRVEFFRANSQPNSASSWLIYSPGEAAVMPGTTHQIRVTISVPADAEPGDHLAALIIEQRPETLKYEQNLRQMVVRYRMASVFYIKVPGLTKQGNFKALYAKSTPDGIVVTPTLKNDGNSMIRPVASVKIVDAEGRTVAEMPDVESIPILAGAELSQSVVLSKTLAPGNYLVKYRIDFGDGARATEGVTDLTVKPAIYLAAAEKKPLPKP